MRDLGVTKNANGPYEDITKSRVTLQTDVQSIEAEERVEFRDRSASAINTREIKKVGRPDKKFVLDDSYTRTGGQSRTKSEYSQAERSLVLDETIDELQSNKKLCSPKS